MPLVNATPKGRLDGSTVTQFTNTTNINSTTYTYPTTQTNLIIENSGEHDIFLTVGTVTDQLIKVDTKYQYDGQFTQFAIRSDIDSQEFIATAIYQELTDFDSINTKLDEHAAQLAQKAEQADLKALNSSSNAYVNYLLSYLNSTFSSYSISNTDILNYGTTSSIDGSGNVLLSKSLVQSFTWACFNKSQLNSEITFTITTYGGFFFVLCGNSTKCITIELTNNYSDFGQISRRYASGQQDNITSAFSDTSGHAYYGDIIKVKRIPTGWHFSIMRSGQSTFVDWFDISFLVGTANLFTEFTEAEKLYGVLKFADTSNEGQCKNVSFLNVLSLTGVSKYTNKTWNSIGDSITYFGKYQPIVQASLGIPVCRNYGKAGYDTTMLKNDLSTWDANADLITFFAGTNDFGRCDTLQSTHDAVNYIFSNLKTKYSGKTIVIFLPLQRWGYTGDTVKGPQTTMTNSDGITLRQYCDTIQSVAISYGFPVLDLYALSGITPDNASTYLSDGLHPSTAGYSLIANVIINYLNSL